MVAAGSITVAVRVRPPSAWEAARLPEPCYDAEIRGNGALSIPGRSTATSSLCLRDIVQIIDDRIIMFDPDEKDKVKAFVERGFLPPGTKRYKDKRFMFDKIFNHEARQQDVYESTAQPLLNGVLDGYNATVFAYGATGCGKTHTISGTEFEPGIIYLIMADLFQRIDDRRDEYNVDVVVTFLEIYNEEIRDLLADPDLPRPRAGLSIREDKTVKVVGLVELRPTTAEEVKEIVLQGNSRRTQSPTHANETSSRSHAVLQVHISQSPRTASITEQRTVATLSIIDLAGSERAAATSNMGQRMVEGANINKSLLALGNCINALCESGGATRHVPYRNSKLTRLLKFSLGGNCKTVMIVCVAPTSNHFDETHNTLLYAERATKIKTKVVTRNVVNVDRHVGRYVEAINNLNIEVAELKAKLAGKLGAEADILRRRKTEASAEVDRCKSDMKSRAAKTRASILDGATCSGKLSVAKAKLAIIRRRLQAIDAQSQLESLSQDLVAERALLQALASADEQVIKPDSALNVRLQRSNNSMAMFDATLRAVSERKSEKLDEVSVDNVKLDSQCRKIEMERVRAEEERDVMMGAVEGMADMVVTLLGMLGRCTVMMGDAGLALSGAMEGGFNQGTEVTVKRIAAALKNVKEKNDEVFVKLVGHSTEGYTIGSAEPTSSLEVFKGYATTFTRRSSSGSSALQRSQSYTRRSSSYSSIGSGRPSSRNVADAGHSPRRSMRSPRKSLRSSLAGAPYKRPTDRGRKTVQWVDEAGHGNIDDAQSQSLTQSSSAITAPEVFDLTPDLPLRQTSSGGSESDWEDEVERTDESVSFSFASSVASFSGDTTLLDSSLPSKPYTTKRSRPRRLDPNFLKMKSKASTLGILTEDEEPASPTKRGQGQPLADRSVNQLTIQDDDPASSSGIQDLPTSRHPRTSPRKGSSMPRVPSGKSTSGRRRSIIGPLRVEKSRRRSSMIPQLSPCNGESSKGGGPRRVIISDRTPAKRGKRLSLLSGSGVSKLTRKPSSLTPMGNLSILGDVSGSTDISFNKSLRPTWR